MNPADYYAADTDTTSRARVIGYLKAAKAAFTDFVQGSIPHQIVEGMVSIITNASALRAQLVRGMASLDTATDPGDYDPYDASNASATPGPGYLSAKGKGDYGTERIFEGYANGVVTITNAGVSAVYIAPEQVTFTRDTVNTSTNLPVTYRNTRDASIYSNPDGTATIAAGATLDVTVTAEEKGVLSNAGAGTITLTTSLGTGVAATNAASVVATAKEDADAYRERCRTAAAILSLNGPEDAYRWMTTSAKKNPDTGAVFFFPPWGDGTTGIGVDSDGNRIAIPNATGDSLGVTRCYVDADSATGNVDVYLAGPSGEFAGGDTDQVVLDASALCLAYCRPQCNTVTFHSATNTTANIVGTIYAKAGAGVTQQVIADAANAAILAAFPDYDIGGYNQTAGAGYIYSEEIDATINGSHPRIYRVVLSSPGTVSLAKGHVAVPSGTFSTSDVVIT